MVTNIAFTFGLKIGEINIIFKHNEAFMDGVIQKPFIIFSLILFYYYNKHSFY